MTDYDKLIKLLESLEFEKKTNKIKYSKIYNKCKYILELYLPLVNNDIHVKKYIYSDTEYNHHELIHNKFENTKFVLDYITKEFNAVIRRQKIDKLL